MKTDSPQKQLVDPIAVKEYNEIDEQERQAHIKNFMKIVIFYFACPVMMVMWLTDGIYQQQTVGLTFVIRSVSFALMSISCFLLLRQKTLFWTQVWATLTGCSAYFALHLIYYLRGDPNSRFIFATLPALVILATGVRLTWFFYFLNCSLIFFPILSIGLILSPETVSPSFIVDMINWSLTLTFCTSGRWFFEKTYIQERISRLALKNEASEREFILSQAIDDLMAGQGVSKVLVQKVPNLARQWEGLTAKFKDYREKEAEIVSSRRMAELARQVAHDIRSPLSALTLMTNNLKEIPEEKRLIVKSASVRINDIANELLSRRTVLAPSEILDDSKIGENDVLMLSAIVDQMTSEKRAQYRDLVSVQIETDLTESFGSFVFGQNRELMRLLSNLIDNAVESLNEKGLVSVVIKTFPSTVTLSVRDNGIGIPPEILSRIGEKGFSHGKQGGSRGGAGLGVYHAKKMIQEMGGRFDLVSEVGQGTIITMTLKKANAPVWFAKELSLQGPLQIVIMDDDLSIHHLWKSRLEAVSASGMKVSVTSFTSPEDFQSFVSSREISDRYLFLVDFELLYHEETGLNLIRKLGIEKESVLVTSHWDEHTVRSQCEALQVRLLPKSLAGVVPVSLNAREEVAT